MKIKVIFLSACLLVLVKSYSQSGISGVINIYTKVTGVAPQSATVIATAGLSALNKVLIIQMKGAGISTVNAGSYGTISSYNNAGNYEFAIISNISGNVVTFQSPLLKNYTPSDLVQLIRVPVYNGVTVNGMLTCAPWNGNTGGVLAFESTGAVTMSSNIDVGGLGFTGGMVINGAYTSTGNINYVLPSPSPYTSEKGEGIFSMNAATLLGRGKNANGGGGGSDLNGGGAGGSNCGDGGDGGNIMSSASTPSYILITCGGVGGQALTYANSSNKIFLGGGGGAGHENDNLGTSGGNGGGMIIIKAASISGNNNSIMADGSSVPLAGNDGQGGGGAGGTILLDVPANGISNCTISAKGGDGGSDTFTGPDCHGKGGGGGGGIIWSGVALPGNVTIVLNGGSPGTYTNSNSVCYPGSYGATAGTNGCTLTGLQMPMNTGPTTDIKDLKEYDDHISIFPNPSNGMVTVVNLYNDETLSIKITDVTSKTVFSKKLEDRVNLLDISILSPAIYFVAFVKENGQIVRRKLVIE